MGKVEKKKKRHQRSKVIQGHKVKSGKTSKVINCKGPTSKQSAKGVKVIQV
jgi:hypothetical protein